MVIEVRKDDPVYPIRTVALLTGVNTRRIRAYEDQYQLLKPARTERGHRLYSEADVELVKLIKLAIDAGLSLKGMQKIASENGSLRKVLDRQLFARKSLA